MVRKHYNVAKRAYSRAKGGLSTILQNPIAIGAITGAIKNSINGQPPINIGSIQRRVTQPNAKNPLLYLLAGYLLKNKSLMTIGAFLIVDPPAEDIYTLSDEEIEALSEEIEADEEEENQNISIH